MPELLRVAIDDVNTESALMDEQVARLRDDLLLLDVERVGRSAGPDAPAGSRSGFVQALAQLDVALAPAVPLLHEIVSVLSEWLTRAVPRGRISLELRGNKLELDGSTRAERQRLIDTWIDACARGDADDGTDG